LSEQNYKNLVEKFGGKTTIVEELIISKIDDAMGLIDRNAAIDVLAAEHDVRARMSDGAPQELKLTKIGELNQEGVGLWFNIKAFVKEAFPETRFTRKDGSTGIVRNVLIQDETGSIRLDCWGDYAKEILEHTHKVVIVKGVQYRKNEFQRRTGEDAVEYRLATGRYTSLIPVPPAQKTLAE